MRAAQTTQRSFLHKAGRKSSERRMADVMRVQLNTHNPTSLSEFRSAWEMGAIRSTALARGVTASIGLSESDVHAENMRVHDQTGLGYHPSALDHELKTREMRMTHDLELEKMKLQHSQALELAAHSAKMQALHKPAEGSRGSAAGAKKTSGETKSKAKK